MSSVYHLFVYGSLRSDFKSEAYQYINGYFTLCGIAKVKGKMYYLKDYPAAIPTREDYFIIGELYTISKANEFSWVMEQLDEYEGVKEVAEKSLYNRELTSVFLNGKTIQSWIYWYNGDVEDKTFIESGDVLEYLRNKKRND